MIGNWRTCDLRLFNGLLSSFFSAEFTMNNGKEGLSSAAFKYMGFMGAERELPGKINDATVVLRKHDENENLNESFLDQSSIFLTASDVEMSSLEDEADFQQNFQDILNAEVSLKSNVNFDGENETISENDKTFPEIEMNIEGNFQELLKTSEYQPENKFTCGEFTEVSVTSSSPANNMFKSPPQKRQRFENFTMMTSDVFNISSKFNSFHGNMETEENFIKFPIQAEALEIYNNLTQLSESSVIEDLTGSFVDESMVPERCWSNRLEQTIMQNGKLNVSTFYSSRVVRNSNKAIDSYYKVQQFQDWNAIAGEMLQEFEPSLDYLYDKFQLPRSVQLGDENQEIRGEMDFEDIRESLKEIKDSFECLEASFVASTPTKHNKSFNLLKKSLGINEVNEKQETNFTELNHSEKIFLNESLEIIEAKNHQENLKTAKSFNENHENFNKSQENVEKFKNSQENVAKSQINLTERISDKPAETQENMKESGKTASKTQETLSQMTKTSQNHSKSPKTSQSSEKKSIKTKTRISQRLEKNRNPTSQQEIKSISDIFADIISTQKTMTPEIVDFDVSFIHLLDREEDRENESNLDIQEPLVDPEFLEVLNSENPVEALQALTQQNPV